VLFYSILGPVPTLQAMTGHVFVTFVSGGIIQLHASTAAALSSGNVRGHHVLLRTSSKESHSAPQRSLYATWTASVSKQMIPVVNSPVFCPRKRLTHA